MINKDFPRWIYLICGFVINLILGVIFSWSVFIEPLEKIFGWTRAMTSGAFALVVLFFSVGMLPAGNLLEKWGPRKVVWFGGFLLALGWILSSLSGMFATDGFFSDPTATRFLDRVEIINGKEIKISDKETLEKIVKFRGAYNIMSLYWLYLTYGVISGIGIGFAYNVPIPVVRRWFPDKAGFAIGLTVMGFGMGALFLAPLAVKLIQHFGWHNAFLYMGIMFLVIIFIAGIFLKYPPEGWYPKNHNISLQEKHSIKEEINFTWREMIRTRQFWLIWLWYWFMAAAGLLVIGHIKVIIDEYGANTPIFSMSTSVLAVGTLSLFNGFGRVVFGTISDKIGRRNTMLADAVLMSLMMFFFIPLVVTFGAIGAILGVVLIGLSYGGISPLMPNICGDYFGTRNLGMNYAILFTAWGVAGILGPVMAGFIRDITGKYELAYIVSGVMCIIAVIISLILKPLHNEKI
ncbi:major facilitator superfamily MFS_1 [Ferroglobus placidus DSM 10642]|uniref:Major facilitator superfamily MFS_1 n=1 Tax=Ferroglobus placidus (strain DSM 10642 / AEDII12DO) TaxID=589924 RepID=D3S2P1_FERPA|nr:OFA family MFS transporter [Ferroglobus placidus]ADC64571.1 major facilitator superfamily MFS_1 [Ferroglobus placidus DSM 10642]